MQNYITQLLSDIQTAHRTPDSNQSEAQQTMEQHFEEVERYISGADEALQQPFCYHCGLKKEQFPPTERLTYEQLNLVCEAFEKLLYSWNLHVTLPDELPVDNAYELLVSVLDRKVMIVDLGFVGLEFCNYEPADCVFGQYCTCKEHLAEMKEEERKMEKYVQQLVKDLSKALKNLPDAEVFRMIHGDLEVEKKPIEEAKTLADWLDIDLDIFPPEL